MTIDQIRAQIREDTGTTTNDYSDASLIRDLNSEVISIHTFLLAQRGTLEYDDPNQTGYSWETITLDGSSDTFDVQQDEHSENIYTIHKVVIHKKDIPRLVFNEGNQDGVLNTTDTAVAPSGFYDLGKAIRFTQIPSAGTATVYYDRQHHYIETGDTSLELGLPRPYHQLAGKQVALNYAERKNLPQVNWLTRQVERIRDDLQVYEEERRGDEPTQITPETLSGL